MAAGQKDSSDLSLRYNKQTWVLALPFDVEVDSVIGNWELSIGSRMRNTMSVQFYTGIRAGVDSLSKLGMDVRLVLVEHMEDDDLYRMQDVQGNLVVLSASEFIRECTVRFTDSINSCKIIGPFRGESSKELSIHSKTIQIINPVSRDLDVAGAKMLVAAAPGRGAEFFSLAYSAVTYKRVRPEVKFLLIDDSNAEVFVRWYELAGGNTSDVQIVELNSLSGKLPRSKNSEYHCVISLKPDVLRIAKVLQQTRHTNPRMLELWVAGNEFNHSGIDALQLLKQPLVWAQSEALVDGLSQELGDLVSTLNHREVPRWELIGIDMTFLLANFQGGLSNFQGPYRSYAWYQPSQTDGALNMGAVLYRYEKELGFVKHWCPQHNETIPLEKLTDEIVD